MISGVDLFDRTLLSKLEGKEIMGNCFFSGIKMDTPAVSNMDACKAIGIWEYWVTGSASIVLNSTSSKDITQKNKFLCLQETIKLNRVGLIPLWALGNKVDPGVMEKYPKLVLRTVSDFASSKINHKDKDIGILNRIAEKVSENCINPFESTTLDVTDRYFLGIFDPIEFLDRIGELKSRGLIYYSGSIQSSGIGDVSDLMADSSTNSTTDGIQLSLTNSGWQIANDENSTSKSKKVFIAMAFTDKDKKELSSDVKDALIETLDQCGFEGNIVSDVGHNDGVMDKIISLIGESRFVIAELTHQKSGVYYEAGFAKAKGLQVIHIVSKEDFDNCHFDVKHLNLIIWSDLNDLKQKLHFRIKATIH